MRRSVSRGNPLVLSGSRRVNSRPSMKKRSFWRDNGLALAMLGFFLLFVVGQTFAGWHDHNNDALLHHEQTASLGEYLVSGDFFEALFENWESEFLQMGAYIVLTVFLFQRGSSESKDPDKPGPIDEDPENHRDDDGAPSPLKSGGPRLWFYKHSLSLAFFAAFGLSVLGHLIGGAKAYSGELKTHGFPEVSPLQYAVSARFWFESLQNWQSEFLAMFCIVVASIYLREHGSPESKAVWSPHTKTGEDG